MQESLIREREVYKDIEAQVMGDDRFYNIDASVLTFLLRAESLLFNVDNRDRIDDIDLAATEANRITGNVLGDFIKDHFVDIALAVGTGIATGGISTALAGIALFKDIADADDTLDKRRKELLKAGASPDEIMVEMLKESLIILAVNGVGKFTSDQVETLFKQMDFNNIATKMTSGTTAIFVKDKANESLKNHR